MKNKEKTVDIKIGLSGKFTNYMNGKSMGINNNPLSFLLSSLRSSLLPSNEESPLPNFLLDTIIAPF